MSEPETLCIREQDVGGHRLLTMAGVLDARTYRQIRDHIVKAALNEPRSVIVDVEPLAVPADSAWSVFTSARWLVDEWPAVPLTLVSGDLARRRLLARCGVTRHVPVYAGVQSATSAPLRERLRLRARLALPASSGSSQLARAFVSLWLSRWERSEMIPVAKVVVTELVENVLTHTSSEPRVRMETDGATVIIAVGDDNPAPASLREGAAGAHQMGLRIVGALSSRWRNAPTHLGKVMWAALSPDNRM